MAVNKDSSTYTMIFATVMVIVVGTILASLSIGLGPIKDKNQAKKKQMDLLSSVGIDATRKNATEKFEKYIPTEESFVINAKGEKVTEDSQGNKVTAFDVDVKKQFRDKKIKKEERVYPVFIATNSEGQKVTICPVVGAGLWGPIWGYIAVGEDNETIVGASFDHKTETPGLGAEIKQDFFEKLWLDEKISSEIAVVKDGTGAAAQKVDGITGGTITSKGVEEMVNRTMSVYSNYFKNL